MNQKSPNHVLIEGKIINQKEVAALLKAIKPYKEEAVREQTKIHYVNDYFLILVGSLTGLRVSEIANVHIGDIGEASLHVVGKGNRARNVPVGRRGRAALDEFLKIKEEAFNQPTRPNEFLFLNRNGRQMSRHGIAARFRFWISRVGIKRQVNFHGLRHGYATHLLNSGFNIAEVSRFLGHSNVSVTSVYLHLTRSTLDRVNAVL